MHTQHNVTTQCPEPGRPTQTHRHTHTSAAPAIAALIDASPSPAPSSRTRLPATNAGSACSTREMAMLEGQIENLINPFNRAYLQLAFDVIRNIGKIFDVLVGN